jgi:chromate transporter
LVAEALWRVAKRALKQPMHVVVAVLAFVALFVFRIPFPIVILAAAIVGLAMAWRSDGRAPAASDEKVLEQSSKAPRPFRTTLIGAALWLGPIALLAGLLGSSHIFPQMGLFFAKMAVVTFGGAYAVLAYVAQQAVQSYGWLTTGNMIDGLALAETTPGPLILVLSFVGFYAAHQQPGALAPMFAGMLGAVFVTWVTFVPSFIWIFLGAPYVERLRQNRYLSAALAMVTAAVVGVIANLALWFALHVLFLDVREVSFGVATITWPDWRSADLVAISLTIAAGLALLHWRVNLVKVLLASGAIGYIAHAAVG